MKCKFFKKVLYKWCSMEHLSDFCLWFDEVIKMHCWSVLQTGLRLWWMLWMRVRVRNTQISPAISSAYSGSAWPLTSEIESVGTPVSASQGLSEDHSKDGWVHHVIEDRCIRSFYTHYLHCKKNKMVAVLAGKKQPSLIRDMCPVYIQYTTRT